MHLRKSIAHITSVDPPIYFRGPRDTEIVIDDADSLAEWLDGLYDVVLAFGPAVDGAEARSPLQLDEIEQLLLAIEAEIAGEVAQLSETLRVAAMSLIGQYHKIDVAFGRTPGQLRKPRGRSYPE